jgi:hypothetical protein
MSDIVKLTNDSCQAGCRREDAMKVQIAETLAALVPLHRKVRDADAKDQGASVTTGFGS